MVRIAIIEDERGEQECIRKYLVRYEFSKKTQMLIEYFEDGADFIESYQNQYDIIFCDIQMKFMGGIETAEKIREQDSDVLIIFITNFAEFAIQGYEVEAFGYILKPLSYHIFERYLDRAVNHMRVKKVEYLNIEGVKNLMRIPVDEILYVDCVKHYQHIHTWQNTYKVLVPLKQLESKLDPSIFTRCHSGCLVHLKHVQKIEKMLVYVADTALPISRSKRKEFIKLLTEYMTNNM